MDIINLIYFIVNITISATLLLIRIKTLRSILQSKIRNRFIIETIMIFYQYLFMINIYQILYYINPNDISVLINFNFVERSVYMFLFVLYVYEWQFEVHSRIFKPLILIPVIAFILILILPSINYSQDMSNGSLNYTIIQFKNSVLIIQYVIYSIYISFLVFRWSKNKSNNVKISVYVLIISYIVIIVSIFINTSYLSLIYLIIFGIYVVLSVRTQNLKELGVFKPPSIEKTIENSEKYWTVEEIASKFLKGN